MEKSVQISFMDINPETDNLWERLPQLLPSGVYIEPTNLCNFQCHFCPTGDPKLLKHVFRPKGIMNWKLYEKIINDFKELVASTGSKIRRLHLYKDGEPLLHKEFSRMVELAKKAEISDLVETTTNGALLTPSIAQQLVTAGLDVIRVSIEHVKDDYYATLTNSKTTYKQIHDNVRSLYYWKTKYKSPLHVHAKIIDTGLSRKEIEGFITDFESISDSWNINKCQKWPSCGYKDFECLNHKDDFAGSNNNRRIVCPEPFTKLAINFNGSVSVCCIDWSYQTIIGDVSKEHINEIWNSKQLRQFRTNHLHGKRFKLKACAFCDYADNLPDLDTHIEKLLPRYQVE